MNPTTPSPTEILRDELPNETLPEQLVPGIPGFSWEDLHSPLRLADLLQTFFAFFEHNDALLYAQYRAYLDGAQVSPVEESRLLVKSAPFVSSFLGRLFGIEQELALLSGEIDTEKVIYRFKTDFVARRVHKRAKTPVAPDPLRLPLVDTLFARLVPQAGGMDEEKATATLVDVFVTWDKEFKQRNANRDPRPVPEASRQTIAGLKSTLLADSTLGVWLKETVLPAPAEDAQQTEHDFVNAILGQLELWLAARLQDPEDAARFKSWPSFKVPHTFDFEHLCHLVRPDPNLPEMFVGPANERRARDGFKLTDPRMGKRQVMGEIDYCLFCHDRDKDSCSKGFHEKDGSYKKNPLGIPLAGCPLDEKISEMHTLKHHGDPLGGLALIIIDNPMLPGTGHRICNDCMKGCIFQKQEPVNIPEIETSVLTDVLGLPWGFELYSLLTRWNPLNRRRPVAQPYTGRNALVVGLGPAGYTLSHYLINEGFGVVGIDGLKLEPLPADLVGGHGRAPRPIRNVQELFVSLDERILSGFGGVSEYGITVRWDKNFLTVIYLNLARRSLAKFYGGVRFGGTVTVEDAWEQGFDHIAIATGAGRPTLIDMKNNLIQGIRKASDFLMALQLTGASKRDNLANLQVSLPALVIGGGLTAIDTCTELVAYYVVQVEKMLSRHEQLVRLHGEARAYGLYTPEEREKLETFLSHGRTVREERALAATEGRLPRLAELVEQWGGVSLVYRKSLNDSPAYRLNHEEVTKSLEEGIRYVEKMSPLEAIPDASGAVSALVFERMVEENGKWRNSGERVTLPARSVFVAAGTSPNTIPEKERPGLFKLDSRKQFFQSHRVVRDDQWALQLQPVGSSETGFFSSYRQEVDGDKIPRLVSFYGDNHPRYAGNVVKAMASAKHGYREVAAVFAEEFAALDPQGEASRLPKWTSLVARLDDALVPVVVKVERLTSTIVDVVVRAPLAARHFEPGQFYRLQNYEATAQTVDGNKLMMEGLALTGAWVDKEQGLLSMIVLEMGTSSRLCAALKPGEKVVVMGPTGFPTEIPENETVALVGGGLGNAVLFSIAKALKEKNNKVIYFAGYRNSSDVFKMDDIEAATDVVVWCWDQGDPIAPRRPQDMAFHGNIVQTMKAYNEGRLGERPIKMCEVDRIIAIGSDKMMAAVKQSRKTGGVLDGVFKSHHEAIGSINSPMQCMMKEVCAQCLQRWVDPETGKESFVFSCFNQDQKLDLVDFDNLNARLKVNSIQEKMTNLWLDHVLESGQVLRV